MKRAIEQAGSVCAGWISSCLFCLGSVGDDESSLQQQSLKQNGAAREMKICHTQPHLVPPMRPAVDDNLPRPSPPLRASSVPSWRMDSSRLLSQTSSRASFSFRRKSTTPLRISGPSEFRAVSSFATSPRGFHPDSFILLSPGHYQPLELSFEASGNQMSGLPGFEDFQLEEERPVPARPPRILRTSAELSRLSRSKSHRPSSSFQLARKPVGQSSLATLEQLMDKQVPITNPLIPHFSNRSPTVTGLSANLSSAAHTRLDSTNGCGSVLSKLELSKGSPASKATILPRTPANTNLQDRPLPSIPVESSLSSGTAQRPPTTPTETRPPTTPSENHGANPAAAPTPTRSGRVTQWLCQASSKASPPSSSPPLWKTAFIDKSPFRIRSRTLSGSTLTSTLTNLTGGFKTTQSLSDNTTAASLIPSSNFNTQLEKELHMPMSFSWPYLPEQTDEPTAYSTKFEGQQHQNQRYELDESGHNCYTTYRRSAVGLAF